MRLYAATPATACNYSRFYCCTGNLASVSKLPFRELLNPERDVMEITLPRDLCHRRAGGQGVFMNAGQDIQCGVAFMLTFETDSERVTAEITTSDVLRIAREVGMPVSTKEAQLFLRDGSRAHTMWKQMIEAGRQYIAESLEAERRDIWWSEIAGDAGASPEEYDA